MSIINNENRIGRFTSSKISALMSEGKIKGTFGKPALTYIQEKNYERKLGRSLSVESNAKALVWGKLCECVVFNKLGENYYPVSGKTIEHPYYNFWSGSPDARNFENDIQKVVEIKCPLTLKSFCQFAECETIEEVREKHPDGEDYYWQIVSNGILTNCTKAELIIYCPLKSELDEIREMATDYWIAKGTDEELPWIPENSTYKNLIKFEFEIPDTDIQLLTKKVVEAGGLLK